MSTDSGLRLMLEGELTAARARPLYAKLLSALEAGRDIDIDVAEVVRVDLTFLQMVCALARSAAPKGVRVRITGRSDIVDGASRLVGFDRHLGCVTTCPWTACGEVRS